MKQIEPRQRARSPTYLMLLILVIVAAVALSVSGMAVAKKCDNPPCGGGGGGDDHGDPPARYHAELISGGFYFEGQEVIRNNRGNSYRGTEGLVMYRESEFPDTSLTDTDAWDGVFSTCPTAYPEAYPANPIPTATFGDDWSIDNSGGTSAGEPGSRVTLALRNGWASPYSEVEIDLFLVGTLPSPGIPSSPGESIEIPLETFSFYVHAHGNDSCKLSGEDLSGENILEMTRIQP